MRLRKPEVSPPFVHLLRKLNSQVERILSTGVLVWVGVCVGYWTAHFTLFQDSKVHDVGGSG